MMAFGPGEVYGHGIRTLTEASNARVARSVLAEVQCYSVDSRGYYSELNEFDFIAELDLYAPLGRSLANSAHPVSHAQCGHSLQLTISVITGVEVWWSFIQLQVLFGKFLGMKVVA